MPPASKYLDVNVHVSVSKQFIKHKEVKQLLSLHFDWNTPGLSFKGVTTARSTVNGNVKYDVILALSIVTEDLLKDAIQEEEQEEDEIDLAAADTWITGQVHIGSSTSGPADGLTSLKAWLDMKNAGNASSLDYFLFFLPLDHFCTIVWRINAYATSIGPWMDITFAKYMMWIALITVITVINHSNKKAYWKQGSSLFLMNIDSMEYLLYRRIKEILKTHVLKIPF
ncbi:hypothetical protein K493DRAFT_308627 [Basidiobolus meristosporus CBS 931.73]|uniref:PiggyBac transposable element-derived protein domain-containing protein n=1 Tax=Basidiobolus meristosporus CBS 931.73 TaxID=1314790 RepID=A0A1Y1WZF6_9FUNG|nr:hypothetical protein K493DRAFT_308627 [Basidiobolus meristosporus CBS 931.73]|eukprot:ORX78883.1 hypothetical protein K493DRAFT_308627 [Basidiobolus meristosporus CBS 931.73]